MKICVVEDETTIRKSIIHKLLALSSSYEVYDVGYGFMAEEKLMLIRPNLVFLDIFMPELNGLELLRRVRDHLPDTRFVILTGYSEFEYAREALQLGVKDYLLKPVYDKELEKVVNETHEELVKVVENHLAQQLQLLEQTGYVISITSIHSFKWWLDAATPKIIVMETESNEPHDKNCIFRFHASHIGSGAVIAIDEPKPGCFRIPADWSIRMRQTLDLHTECRFFGEREAETIRRRRSSHADTSNSARTLRQTMTSAIGSCASELALIQEWFDKWTQLIGTLPLQLLKQECVSLLSSLDGALQNRNARFIEDADKKYWENWIGTFREWKKLRAEMEQLVRKGLYASYRLNATEKLHDSEIAERILAMLELEKDYSEVSLDRLADNYHIHPVTLSRLFKKHTGINFIQYLTKKKMDMARYLLLHTNKKVHEISEELGYSNYRYFSALFKKEFHMLPQQMRKQEPHTSESSRIQE